MTETGLSWDFKAKLVSHLTSHKSEREAGCQMVHHLDFQDLIAVLLQSVVSQISI